MSSRDYVVSYVQYPTIGLIADILQSLYFECKSIAFESECLDRLKTEEEKARKNVLKNEEVQQISTLVEQVNLGLQYKHKKRLVFIIDQMNNLMRNKKQNNELIQFITGELFPGNIVILSSSANNEIEDFKGIPPQMVRLPFTKEELKAFIIMNRPPNEHDVWCNDQIVSQILDITGSVAIEINRFVNGFPTSVTLFERFSVYEQLYCEQYPIEILQSWYIKRKDEGHGKVAIQNIARLIF